jgi:hypothetical protein
MGFIANAAIATVGPAIARRARWSWVGYGMGAYVLLRVARHYGVLGSFPDRAITTMETAVRSAVGLRTDHTSGVAAGARA